VLVSHGVFPAPAPDGLARDGLARDGVAEGDPTAAMPRLPHGVTPADRRDPDAAASLRRWGIDDALAAALITR